MPLRSRRRAASRGGSRDPPHPAHTQPWRYLVMTVLDDLGLTVDDLREAVRDGTLAPTSPGYGANSAPVLPPATRPGPARSERERARRRERALDVLGRADAGSTGD